MAGGGPIHSGNNSVNHEGKNYALPIFFMVTLFFFIGFITVLNDVLIPSLRDVFDFKNDKLKAMLIQFCFFTGYFLMSVPAGMIVSKVGYKKGLLLSLGVTSLGLIMFWPAAHIMSYGFYLTALFIVACGLAILQVVINPYLVALGPKETGSSRLNLGGALNSTATAVGPIIGASFLLQPVASPEEKAQLMVGPYSILAFIILAIGLFVLITKLPKLNIDSDPSEKPWDFSHAFRFNHLRLGAGAIFFYVGAEVAIGSLLVIYIVDSDFIQFAGKYVQGMDDGGIDAVKETFTASLLAYYWGGAMVGRFFGSVIMRYVRPEKALATASIIAILLVVLSMFSPLLDIWVPVKVFVLKSFNFVDIKVPLGILCLVLVGLFNSIMWPTIFPLGIKDLGKHTGKGSGLMVTMVFGGAIIPLVNGFLADAIGYRWSFLLVIICYLYILYFAVDGHKNRNPEETRLANDDMDEADLTV